jgi:hypothetical protein
VAKYVLLLEDTAARVEAMRPVLRALLPDFPLVSFDNVVDFIDWIEQHLPDVALICLDHDLGPTRLRDGERFDPGIGRDAADVLAMRPPVCPVIIHSSNSIAVPGMLHVLRESGWTCSAVMPSDDLRWIDTDWRQELTDFLLRGWIST